MKKFTFLSSGISAGFGLFLLCACDGSRKEGNNVAGRDPGNNPSGQIGNAAGEKDPTPSQSSKDSQVTGTEKDELSDELRRIFPPSQPGSELSPENLARLGELVPRLRAEKRFWDVIGAVSPGQLPHFRDAILADLRNLDYQNGSYVNPDLRNAYRVANWLRDKEVASTAFAQLEKEKPFIFPKESPLKDWPTAEHAEYLLRGNQGILAAAVVGLGDEKTMEDYRRMLESASDDSQRVLIWALGGSHRLEDFDLLMRLREKIQSREVADTLIQSLNRIPESMERVARSPETTSPENRPSHPESLLAVAESCRKRLADLNLTLEPTFGD
ncbi:hypothetical protein GCM10023212_14070 [Luteolibacter yonseiensis]